MRKSLLIVLFNFFIIACSWAQSDQTVVSGTSTSAVNFTGAGCSYTWTNSNPSIGLPASGTGNIPAFTAVNNGTSSVTATVNVTPAPAEYIYMTNTYNNTLEVINTATNTIVATIPTQKYPIGVSVSPDGTKVYVSDQNPGGQSSISVINTTTNTVIATIPGGVGAWGIVTSPDGKWVYVANETSGTVSVINATNNTLYTDIAIPAGAVGIAISPDGSRVYVAASYNTNSYVVVINTANNTVIKNIPVNNSPWTLAVSPDGSRVYVANAGANNVQVINTSTNTVIATIPVGNFPIGAVVSPDGSRVYITNNYGNSISVIDAATNTVITTISDGQNPEGLSISPDGKDLYVVNTNSHNVAVFDTQTNTLINQFSIDQSGDSQTTGNFLAPGANCTSTPVTFTITVNPSGIPPVISASAVTGHISACAGTASFGANIQQFTVSGTNLQSAITATAPAGFEVSLNAASGYGFDVILTQTAGALSNTTVYVRSATSAATGNISGNVTLSSTGAANQTVAVTGVVNTLPTVSKVADQAVTNGSATTAVNFAGGTGNTTFNWVNNTPGIGLPATGIGNIGSFTAVNNGDTPITATITATPVSEGYAYITNDGLISVINVATNKVISNITPPHDPFCVCISPDGSKAYIGCSDGSSTVTVINTITNTIMSTIHVSSSGESTGITVSPDGNTLYVANYVDGTVSAVNIATGAVTVIHVGPNPYAIAITPDGSKVYVGYTYGNYISVINTATNTVAANITVGTSPTDVVVSPDGSKVYVPVSSTNSIAVIDPATNNVIQTIPIGATPVVMVLSPDGSTAYVATISTSSYPYPSSVLVVNMATNKVIATMPVGAASNGISITPDGSFVYVVNTETNDVAVINTLTNKVVTKVNVGNSPISLGNFITPGTGCSGTPTTFTITVNPTPKPTITAGNVSGSISSCVGTASVSPNIQQFTVSGSLLTTDITATAPVGFELSLNETSDYSNSLTLTQTGGTINSTVIYVRSSASANAGNISGNVVLSSASATTQNVAVTAAIDALPVMSSPGNQIFVNGTESNSITFSGTDAATYKWTNNTPGIGLPASGEGNIAPFAAVSNASTPVTATITVTPFNSLGCSGTPVSFTITITQPALNITGNLTPLTTVYGTPSTAENFTVSGVNITSGTLITPPTGFELSLDGNNFSKTLTAGSMPVTVFIRLAATTPVGDYTGNIVCSNINTASVTLLMPNSTVTPAPLTIKADDKVRVYGTDNPLLTVTYSGFVNKDNAAVLDPPVSVSTNATAASAVGQYPIIAYGAGAANYTFIYLPGTLTIQSLLLVIPNTFTPNGDGVNDTWNIKNMDNYPNSSVNIFNRWGQKLYTSIGYPIPWDGKYNGSALPAGTYYYIIDPKNGHGVISGWVAIIR
jgi:gliding motility-associated-like protein